MLRDVSSGIFQTWNSPHVGLSARHLFSKPWSMLTSQLEEVGIETSPFYPNNVRLINMILA